MAISLYNATVAGFVQILGAAEGVLEKGRVYCEANNIDLAEIVEARLISDMAPFRFQITQIVQHTMGALDGVKAGVFTPDPGPLDADYGVLQRLLANNRARLAAFSDEEINALEGKDVLYRFGEMVMSFTAENFLLSYSTPNLHFHATTAYDILRSKGVPLGKRDYMGRPRLKV